MGKKIFEFFEDIFYFIGKLFRICNDDLMKSNNSFYSNQRNHHQQQNGGSGPNTIEKILQKSNMNKINSFTPPTTTSTTPQRPYANTLNSNNNNKHFMNEDFSMNPNSNSNNCQIHVTLIDNLKKEIEVCKQEIVKIKNHNTGLKNEMKFVQKELQTVN